MNRKFIINWESLYLFTKDSLLPIFFTITSLWKKIMEKLQWWNWWKISIPSENIIFITLIPSNNIEAIISLNRFLDKNRLMKPGPAISNFSTISDGGKLLLIASATWRGFVFVPLLLNIYKRLKNKREEKWWGRKTWASCMALLHW